MTKLGSIYPNPRAVRLLRRLKTQYRHQLGFTLLVNESLKRVPDESAQALRFARAPDQHDGDESASDERPVAPHVLTQFEAGAADLDARGDDFEHVVHAAGFEIVDLDMTHDEDRGLARLGVGETVRVDAEQPDEIRAPALAELEEVGVIDDAAAIGVLEIGSTCVSPSIRPARSGQPPIIRRCR